MLRIFGPGHTRGHDIRGSPHLIIENAIWCHFFLDGLFHHGCHAPKEVHLSWVVLAVRSPAKREKTANIQGKMSHSVTAYLSQTISTVNGYRAAWLRGSDSPVHSPIITLRGLPERERKGRSREQAHSGHVQTGHSYRARCSFIRWRCDYASLMRTSSVEWSLATVSSPVK